MALVLRNIEPLASFIASAINSVKTYSLFGTLASDASTDVTSTSAAVTAVADTVAAASSTPTKAEFDAVVALANDLKAKYNAAVTLMNEQKADFNALRATVGDLRTKSGVAYFHADAGEVTVTSADATGLASSLTLVNELLAVYEFHMADTLAHKAAGVALASYTFATDLATAITRANDIKSKYTTHRASTTYHYVADSTNTISASDATDQSSLNTLLNELKSDINAHIIGGPAASSIRLVSA